MAGRRSANGRPRRTGQRWAIVSSTPPSSVQTTVSSVQSPAGCTATTCPDTPGDAMMRCAINGVSGTLPNLNEQIDMDVFAAFQIPYSALQLEHEDVIAGRADRKSRMVGRRRNFL